MSDRPSVFPFLPPIEGKAYCGCGCGARASHAPLTATVHPGFGGVSFSRDGHYGGSDLDDNKDATFADYEAVAAADPDHDWRIRIDGPLADYTYQRQGEATWALVEQGQGFA
jgi:hypothetical protein